MVSVMAESKRVSPPAAGRVALDPEMQHYAKSDVKPDGFWRKTKIICTMGPACWSEENLVKMIDAGMNVARLNFSHGDHEAHGATLERIRAAQRQRPNKPVAILLDTKGPEIRSGFFEAGGSIELKQGQDLKLVTDYSFKGDSTCVACSYPKLPTSVTPGSQILMADGTVVLEVTSCGEDHVMTKVMNNAKLGERKNMNLPGVHVDLPVLGEKDINDLLNFGIPQHVDFVAASFVQSAEDVKFIRSTLGPRGKRIEIISKIENEAGLLNFDEILAETDGVMVARGDLGMEIPPENVFLAQKMMIAKCNLAGKPVITATQMLESMCTNPRPTRAEAGDVANAVLDGTDCTMLSGETAGGAFPLNAVDIMRRTNASAESAVDYGALFDGIRAATLQAGLVSPSESVGSSAVKTAMDLDAKLIICVSSSGFTGRMLAKYRPKQPVLVVTDMEQTTKHLCICRGVATLCLDRTMPQDMQHVLQFGLNYAKENGMVSTDDLVLAVHGTGLLPGGSAFRPGGTSTMSIISVS